MYNTHTHPSVKQTKIYNSNTQKKTNNPNKI